MRLRPAATADIEAIMAVHQASVNLLCARAYSPAQIVAWTGRHGSPASRLRWADKIQGDAVWVAVEHGAVCGFAHWRWVASEVPRCYLNALYLDPNVVGRGVGAQLIGKLVDQCRAERVAVVATHATANAVDFYERMGFTASGEVLLVDMDGVGIESYPMTRVVETGSYD